jgi:hypothetical protein
LEFENGKPAGKPRIEETSTTIPGVGVGFKWTRNSRYLYMNKIFSKSYLTNLYFCDIIYK